MAGTEIDKAAETSPVLAALADPAIHRQLERALKPSGISTDYFVRVLQTEVRRSPALQRCTPESFLGAMMTSAELGLRIGLLGEAWMIPRKGEACLQVGYQGWMKLARNANGKISLGVVYEGDEFTYDLGTSPFVHHAPALEGEHADKDIKAFWAQVESPSGERILAIMSKADVEKHRDRYAQKVGGKFNQPWLYDTEGGNFDQMGLKSVVIKAVKWAPKSPQMERAYEAELNAEPAFDIEGEAEEVPPAEEEPRVNKAQIDAINNQLERTGVDWPGVQGYLRGQRAKLSSTVAVPETMEEMGREEGKEVLAVLKAMSDRPVPPRPSMADPDQHGPGAAEAAREQEAEPAVEHHDGYDIVEGEATEVTEPEEAPVDEAEKRRRLRVESLSMMVAEGKLSQSWIEVKLKNEFKKPLAQMDNEELDAFLAWYTDLSKKVTGR
jgi:recombination protein RecT